MTYAITPLTASVERVAFPQSLQWQRSGAALGEPNARVVNFVVDTAVYSVTRGTGEQSNVITIKQLGGDPTPPPTGDPLFASVLLLLHMDALGSTSYVDDSGTHKTMTTLSTPPAQVASPSKFGNSVAQFIDAGGSIILVATPLEAAQFAFPTGDFTIEMWVYRTSAPTNSVLFRWGDVNSQHPYSLYINNSAPGSRAAFEFYGWDDTGTLAYNLYSTTTVALNTWYFVQARRSGNVMALAVNGVQEASTTLAPGSTTLFDNEATKVGIGDYPDGSGVRFHGYVDEVRITRAARDFALQTEIFPSF